MSLIRFTFELDGEATNVNAVRFSAPDASYGLKRTDNDTILVTDDTLLTNVGTGIYEYDFTDPAPDLTYDLWIAVQINPGGLKRYWRRVKPFGLIEFTGAIFSPLDGIEQDATIFHSSESIVAHKRGWSGGAETDTQYEVAHALRRSTTEQDVRALEQYLTSVATVWHLPIVELPAELRRDDWIEAADANWTVIGSRMETFGTRQRCLCIRQEEGKERQGLLG